MKLKEFADLRIGLPVKRWQTASGTEYRLLSAKYIDAYGRIAGSETFRGHRDIPETFFTQRGDIIMKMAAPNQTLCITRAADCGLLVSSYFAIIRCLRPDLCSPEFLTVYFNSLAFTQIAERERICSTVKSLKISTLQEMEIPLPDSKRQQEIVDFSALANDEQKQLRELLLLKEQYHQFVLLRQFGGCHAT